MKVIVRKSMSFEDPSIYKRFIRQEVSRDYSAMVKYLGISVPVIWGSGGTQETRKKAYLSAGISFISISRQRMEDSEIKLWKNLGA